MVDLRVCVDCPGCARKIKKALEKLDGVENVNVDIGNQKVSVTGYADQQILLDNVRKMGKRAEPWTAPYNPKIHNFDHFYKQQKTFNRTANPDEKYYSFFNANVVREFSYDPLPLPIGDDNVAALFSDDNPTNCSIM